MSSKPTRIEGIAAGSLENLGLGRLTPFVKLGLDSMTGNWHEMETEVSVLASGFEADIVFRASRQSPLGNFQTGSEGSTPLSATRLTELLKGFNSLIGKSGGPNGTTGFDGLRRVFATVNLLHNTFNDYNQYTKQAAGTVYSNLKM